MLQRLKNPENTAGRRPAIKYKLVGRICSKAAMDQISKGGLPSVNEINQLEWLTEMNLAQ